MRVKRSTRGGEADITRGPRSHHARHESGHPDPQPHRLLRLQRSIGNHAVQRMHSPGSTGLIQRQPDTSDAGPIGDAMEFIESQLSRRFVDPEDPRLSIRVSRLQEAVRKLTRTEARRLLDRLKDRTSPDPVSQNFQRLATPSRQKLLAGLRDRLPAAIEGRKLGTLTTGSGPSTTATPLLAALEIVPSTSEVDGFAGFDDVMGATDAALRRPTITAIIKDKRTGLERVFETGVPTVRGGQTYGLSVADTGSDYELTDWMNVEGPALPDPKDRAARIQQATELRDKFYKTYKTMGGVDPARDAALAKVVEAYKALVAEAIPFATDSLNVSMDLDYVDTSGQLHHVTTASSSKINIDISGRHAGGFQSVLDPNQDIADLPDAHHQSTMQALVKDRPAIDYEPFLALTQIAITDEPLETRTTLLHEEAHLAHDRRTLELYQEWNSGSSGSEFKDWVTREVAAHRVSAMDGLLAIEGSSSKPLGFSPNTELLAEVEGFMGGYHAVGAANREGFFKRLSWLGHRWSHADPTVQQLAMRKLRHYYERILKGEAKTAFDEYALNALMNGDPNKRAPTDFFIELVQFPEGK